MLLAIALLVAAASPAPPTAAEREVRDIVLRAGAAYAANDLKTYFSFYDQGLTQWWPSGRMDLPGYKTMWTKFIADEGRVLSADASDLDVQVAPGEQAAVASYRIKVVTRGTDGKTTTDDIQESDVFFKRGNAWKLVHLHYSLPHATDMPQ
jgi:ketosteroid isomerase-like protein